MNVVIAIDFQWPSAVTYLFAKLGAIVNFNLLEVTTPECFGIGFQEMHFFTLCAPFFILYYTAQLWCCTCVCKLYCNACNKMLSNITKFVLTLLVLLYLQLATAALSPFDCVGVGSSKRYMRDDLSVECSMSDGAYSTYFTASMYALILYCAFPLLWLSCALQGAYQDYTDPMWTTPGSEDYLEPGEREKLRTQFMATYGTLYLRYEREFPVWEVCIMLRKLAFVLVQRLLGDSPAVQLAMLFFIVAVSLLAQHKYQPFLNSHLDRLEECSLCTVLAVVVVACLSQTLAIGDVACTVLVVLVLVVGGTVAAHTFWQMIRDGGSRDGDSGVQKANNNVDVCSPTAPSKQTIQRAGMKLTDVTKKKQRPRMVV